MDDRQARRTVTGSEPQSAAGIPAAVGRLARHPYLRSLVGFTVAAIFCWLIARQVFWKDLASILVKTDIRYLPAMAVILFAGHGIRITRWWIMLRRHSSTVTWAYTARVFFAALALNNFLPLRPGDLMRMFAFRSDPNLPWSRVAGTLVAERLFDLISLLAIFFVTMRMVGPGAWSARLADFAGWILFFITIGLLALVFFARIERRVIAWLLAQPSVMGRPLVARLLHHISTAIHASVALGSYRRIGALIALSLIAWLVEGCVFILGITALGAAGGILAGLLALVGATFGTIIPSSPGYVGTFHFFAAEAISAFGNSPATGMAFAITVHGVLWVCATLCGLIAIFISARRGEFRPWEAPSKGA